MKNRTRIAVAALALMGAACSDVGGPGGNRTQILLTDDPFPYHMVERVDIHFVRLEATAAVDSSTGVTDPQWVTLATPNRTINLLDYQAGATTLLGEVDLPVGDYKLIRVTIDTRLSSMSGVDGAPIHVNWGPLDEITLYAFVEDPLPVSPSGARIVLDFDVGRSFQQFNGTFVFSPWIRAVNEAATGAIGGVVTFGAPAMPLADAVVSAFRGGPEGQGGWLAATARTDAQGRYTLAYLSRDAYWLVIEPPLDMEGHRGPCVRSDSIIVVQGQRQILDAELPSLGSLCDTPTGPDTTGTDTTTHNPGGPVHSVGVTVSPAHPAIGDSSYAIATLLDEDGVALFGRAVEWTITGADTTVLEIRGVFGQYLQFRPTKPGTVTVTATSEGKSGSVVVAIP